MTAFTQWHGLTQHLGRWRGWFISLDPEHLRPLSYRQSLITFERLASGGIRQTNLYGDLGETLDDSSGRSWVYHDLAGGLRFFPQGSFSNGRLQIAPFTDFAAEQGFLWGDRKARLVTQFNVQGLLNEVTLILEQRGQWQTPDLTYLSPEQIQCPWQGEGLEFTPADFTPIQKPVQLLVAPGSLRLLPGQLWISGNIRVPDPLKQRDRSFQLHLGWMPEPGVCLQLTRAYDCQGAWQRVTWIQASSDQSGQNRK